MYVDFNGRVFEDVAYIKPSYTFLTRVREGGLQRSARQIANQVNLANNNHNGEKSEKARRNIRLILGWILLASKKKMIFRKDGSIDKVYRLTFATLTLPSKQRHSDLEIKSKCLNQMLIELGRYHRVYNYIWIAETQSNGNIHFHLTLDRYINKHSLRIMWNRIINKLGYVDDFFKKHGHSEPPTTEITAVKKVKKIEAYFSGEFTGDKSKDYHEYENRQTKEKQHRFKGCNPYAIIGHERAILPSDPSHIDSEANYARWMDDRIEGITIKDVVPSVYSFPALPNIDDNGNIFGDQDKALEQTKSNEPETEQRDNRFYIKRRPIEGKIWAAGGAAAHEKGVKIVLTDEAIKRIDKKTKEKPDIVRVMERQDKLTGLKVSFGALLLVNIMAYHDSDLPELSNPVKELINRLQKPYTPLPRPKIREDTS